MKKFSLLNPLEKTYHEYCSPFTYRSRIQWIVYVINIDFVLNSTLVLTSMSSTCQVLIVATSTTRQHTCLSVWDINRMKQLPGFPSHFFGLTKIHDISRFFKVNFQVFFLLFLKYDL